MITFFSMHHATISRGWTALSPIFGANFASIKCSFWGLRLQPRWNLMIQSATNDEHPWYRMISKSYRDTSTLGIFRLTLIMTVRTAAPSPNRCVSTSLLAHSASNPPHLSSDLPVTFRPTKISTKGSRPSALKSFLPKSWTSSYQWSMIDSIIFPFLSHSIDSLCYSISLVNPIAAKVQPVGRLLFF